MTRADSYNSFPYIDVQMRTYIDVVTSDKPRTIDALLPAMDTIGADEVDTDSVPDEIRFYFDGLQGLARIVEARIEIAATLQSAFGETSSGAPSLFD